MHSVKQFRPVTCGYTAVAENPKLASRFVNQNGPILLRDFAILEDAQNQLIVKIDNSVALLDLSFFFTFAIEEACLSIDIYVFDSFHLGLFTRSPR